MSETIAGGVVHPELAALLAVQKDDEAVRVVERALEALAPRLASLDRSRQRGKEELARSESMLAKESERYRALESRILDHKQRHEKNLATLNQAHKLREATAAMAQVESARRVLAEEESELLGLGRRLTELRNSAAANRDNLEQLEMEQVETRSTMDVERTTLTTELGKARAKREQSAAGVSRALMARYDRMNVRRRDQSVFALRGNSCGNCDTAIPLQRRPALVSGQVIETCEACGVLLYVEPVPSADAAATS